jgi:hypothetical protein
VVNGAKLQGTDSSRPREGGAALCDTSALLFTISVLAQVQLLAVAVTVFFSEWLHREQGLLEDDKETAQHREWYTVSCKTRKRLKLRTKVRSCFDSTHAAQKVAQRRISESRIWQASPPLYCLLVFVHCAIAHLSNNKSTATVINVSLSRLK